VNPDRYARLTERVAAQKAAGTERRLAPLSMITATTAEVEGRYVDVFCSNDYLGLAHHPDVRKAWRGAGAGSARLIAGDRPSHHALEEVLSDRYGRPVTLFTSGYHANLALMQVLLEEGDVAVSDAMNHASIIDGLRLSKATRVIAPHGTAEVPAGARLVVTEGLFSMDGDVVDLPRLGRSAAAAGAWLCVDEAHAVGVLGPGGRGASFGAGVVPDFVVGTLGKAFGSMGAFVVGPPALRTLLISQGRSFIFTTALPEPAARAAFVALRLADDGLRAQLAANVRRLRAGLWALGISAPGRDHIVPIVLGARTMAVAAALKARGVLVPGIRPPTVAPGAERLRITLSAAHTNAQIDHLLDALDDSLRSVSLDVVEAP
jgi:7-keto-8-aminopelargonate synthetase-like enzyme